MFTTRKKENISGMLFLDRTEPAFLPSRMHQSLHKVRVRTYLMDRTSQPLPTACLQIRDPRNPFPPHTMSLLAAVAIVCGWLFKAKSSLCPLRPRAQDQIDSSRIRRKMCDALPIGQPMKCKTFFFFLNSGGGVYTNIGIIT